MTQRAALIGLVLALTVLSLSAQEQLTLTVAETRPNNTHYTVRRVTLDWEAATIHIALRGVNNEQKECNYGGATATNLMIALNKANLSTRSLNQRIFDRLIADGCLAGSVAGSVP